MDGNAQREEILALSSIYGDELVLEESTDSYQVYSMVFRSPDNVELKLTVKLPTSYPTFEPPTFEINSPYLDHKAKRALANKLETIYADNIGQPVLYQWFEEVRQFLTANDQSWDQPEPEPEQDQDQIIDDQPVTSAKPIAKEGPTVKVISGQTLVDRKSVFQAHVAAVSRKEDVQKVMEQLKSNSKIERATHNMYAYRICDGSTSIQDCDDDGENQAGGRLLHLLQMMDAKNVMVVVSRWYGGVQLGPDRFKHINNVARQVLVENGFASNAKTKK